MRRQQRPDLQHLPRVIRPKNVMHDQHLTIVQRPDPDASFVREANESDQFNARVRSSFPSR
jgi:hypothetical protein